MKDSSEHINYIRDRLSEKRCVNSLCLNIIDIIEAPAITIVNA